MLSRGRPPTYPPTHLATHPPGVQGLANPAARLFSNPAGDYGSMVNERVGAGNWEASWVGWCVACLKGGMGG